MNKGEITYHTKLYITSKILKLNMLQLQYWKSNGYVWKPVIFMSYYEYMLFGNRKMYLKKSKQTRKRNVW